MNPTLLVSVLATLIGLWGLRRPVPRNVSGLAGPGGGGTDLKNIWQDESALRRAFAWLTRTGAGRRMPMPIGWYQQHQVAAIDALLARAKSKGISDPQLFRTKSRQFFAKSDHKWIDLELSPHQLFAIADRQIAGGVR
jgi:hypothetical protein